MTKDWRWDYCRKVYGQSRHRAKRLGVPHNITAHDVDVLLVDQGWRCAVSGIPLERDTSKNFGGPWAASLDRIMPALGYVNGNVRIVCHMVNNAMSEWGEQALWALVGAMIENGTNTEGWKDIRVQQIRALMIKGKR